MKLWIAFTIAILSAAILLVGCTTTQQNQAYTTIGSIETAATAALTAYDDAVIKGQVSTNSVPQVSKAYNDLQAALTLAAAASQQGTNALSTADLEADLGDLFTLIKTVTKK